MLFAADKISKVRELRHAPPAILLSSQLTNHLLHEALGMHVFTVLAKPVDFNVLLDALAPVTQASSASANIPLIQTWIWPSV